MIRLKHALPWGGWMALALIAGSRPADARDAVTRLVFTPSVAIVPEVRTAQGELRTYRLADGATYWKEGLPVFRGDRVKINVFVSSGGEDLAESVVRLDNVTVSRKTAPPWDVGLTTDTLTEGYHFVEAWARTGGAEPRDASKTLVFFVDPRAVGQATTVSPVLETVALSDEAVPKLPPAAGGPSVQISADLSDAQAALTSGKVLRLTGPVEFSISGPAPNEGFVYALYRGETEIHRSERLEVGTRVKLRPDAPDAPGLLPGRIWFVVWGMDRENRLGPARIVPVEVSSASTAGKDVTS